jgi:hypothetical protein
MVSPVMELVANLRGKAFRFGIFGRRSWTSNMGFALVLQWKSAQSGQCDAAARAAGGSGTVMQMLCWTPSLAKVVGGLLERAESVSVL